MYTALYRDFRPETFHSVIGQDHIVKILKNQLRSGTVGHAYLFCGTRGTGKTTTARILAKGLNCTAPSEDGPCGQCENCLEIQAGRFIDVIEIDAASNNGVENIRELKESIKYPPVKGKKKVYIIDEVHMLSIGAFNALLKTLEEPPENIIFILATTEPQKLPATILSRCMRLDFRRVPEQILVDNMTYICQERQLEVEDAALQLIASNADGSVRDSLSLLEQCIAGGEKYISREIVVDLLGTAGEEIFIEMTDLLLQKDVSSALLLLDQIIGLGKDVKQFMKDLVGHLRNLLIVKYVKSPENSMNMSIENIQRLQSQAQQIELEWLNNSILELSKALSDAKWSTQPRILLELTIVKLSAETEELSPRKTDSYRTSKKQKQTEQPARPRERETSPENEKTLSSVPFDDNVPDYIPDYVPDYIPDDSLMQDFHISQEPLVNKVNQKEIPVETVRLAAETGSTDRSKNLKPIWKKAFAALTENRGSFNMFASSIKLVDLNEKTFTIAVKADDKIARKMFATCKQEVEAAMEQATGSRLTMVFSDEQSSAKQTAEKATSSIGEQIKEKYKIKVEYKSESE